jgi:hypothetical protein
MTAQLTTIPADTLQSRQEGLQGVILRRAASK